MNLSPRPRRNQADSREQRRKEFHVITCVNLASSLSALSRDFSASAIADATACRSCAMVASRSCRRSLSWPILVVATFTASAASLITGTRLSTFGTYIACGEIGTTSSSGCVFVFTPCIQHDQSKLRDVSCGLYQTHTLWKAFSSV